MSHKIRLIHCVSVQEIQVHYPKVEMIDVMDIDWSLIKKGINNLVFEPRGEGLIDGLWVGYKNKEIKHYMPTTRGKSRTWHPTMTAADMYEQKVDGVMFLGQIAEMIGKNIKPVEDWKFIYKRGKNNKTVKT